jgi:hypothetical protein
MAGHSCPKDGVDSPSLCPAIHVFATNTHVRIPATPRCPGFAKFSLPRKSEGAGNAGRRCARSRVCSVESTRVSHHGHTGQRRHSLRNGFNGLLRALPGEPGLLSPSPRNAKALSRVDASVGASGPHGFAVRRPPRTPCEETSVHRTLPRVRGDREPPLLLGQDGARA